MFNKDINDLVRYTMVFPEKNYAEKARAVSKELTDKYGARVVKYTNYWAKEPGSYRGLNVAYVRPDGVKFELQFHTRRSFDSKMKAHALYERFRTTPKSRRKELERYEAEMAEIFNKVPVPPGAASVQL